MSGLVLFCLVFSYLTLSCLLGTINALPSKPKPTLSLSQTAARLVSYLSSLVLSHLLFVLLSYLLLCCFCLMFSYLPLSCLLGTINQLPSKPKPTLSLSQRAARLVSYLSSLVLSHLLFVLLFVLSSLLSFIIT